MMELEDFLEDVVLEGGKPVWEKIFNKLRKELKQNATVFCSRPICNKKVKPNKTVKQTWWDNSDIYEYKKIGNKLVSTNKKNTTNKFKKNKKK